MQYNLFLSPSLEALSGNKDKLKRENTYTQRRLVTLSHKDPSVIKRLVKGGGKLHAVCQEQFAKIKELTKHYSLVHEEKKPLNDQEKKKYL